MHDRHYLKEISDNFSNVIRLDVFPQTDRRAVHRRFGILAGGPFGSPQAACWFGASRDG
jgi:hypothetical protein